LKTAVVPDRGWVEGTKTADLDERSYWKKG